MLLLLLLPDTTPLDATDMRRLLLLPPPPPPLLLLVRLRVAVAVPPPPCAEAEDAEAILEGRPSLTAAPADVVAAIAAAAGAEPGFGEAVPGAEGMREGARLLLLPTLCCCERALRPEEDRATLALLLADLLKPTAHIQ